jgi:hypothetical protein
VAPGPRPTALGAPFNEVLNPSFELGLDGWRPMIYTQAASALSVIERTTDWSAGRGDASLRWKMTDAGGLIGAFTNQVVSYRDVPAERLPITAGQSMRIAFDWKLELIDGASGAVIPSLTALAVFWKADGTAISSVTMASISGMSVGDVGQVQGLTSITAPALAAFWSLQFSTSASQYASVTWLIDNVTVTRGYGSTFAPFDGRDVGKGWEGEPGASRSETGTAFADPFALYPRAGRMLESIPPVFQEDPDVRAVIYAQAREADRQEAQMDDLLKQLDPAAATEEGLAWFETLLKTAVSPPGKTVAQRRATVKNRMSRVAGEPAGSGWETAVSEILGVLGTDWDYAEYVPSPATNMIHNPKAKSNGFGNMTWWGAGYSAVGAGTTKQAGSDPEFFNQGLQVINNVAGVPGGTAGDSFTINTGIMSVSYSAGAWYGFRCLFRVAQSIGYGLPTAIATFSNLSSVVRGTVTFWEGVQNLDLDVGSTYWTIEGKFQQPVVGAADTRRLMVTISLPVITTGSTDGNLNMTLGKFMCAPLADGSSPIPDYFDGDTPHYMWVSANVDDDVSVARSASVADTVQIRVPYFNFGGPDPNIQSIRDLTASHLDIEVLYGETI